MDNNHHWSFICLISVIGLLTTWPPSVKASCSFSCDDSPSASGINITVRSSTEAHVTWSSSFGNENEYVLQYRVKNSGVSFMEERQLTDTYFTLTNLMSLTDYEVQVCLAMNSSNCGGCLACFTTFPGPVLGVTASTVDSQSFTVNWDLPQVSISVTDFIVHYSTDMDNLNIQLTTQESNAVVTNNVMPNTTYFVAVSFKSDKGPSALSEIVSVRTRPINDDPGIMVYSFGTRINQFGVQDETVFSQSQDKNFFIDTMSFMVRDIDYDYRRDHLYVTTNDSSIVRYTYSRSELNADSDLNLTHIGSDVLYSGLGDVQSITVDWINERLYWFEFQNNGFTQIHSAPFGNDSSNVKVHGLPIPGSLDSFTADPIHGYFYWTDPGSKLVRIDYSDVTDATPSTDITSLQTVLVYGSKITSFTLDLADLQYYYISTNNTQMVQVKLSGNQGLISPVDSVMGGPTLKTSFGTRVALAVANNLFFRTEEYISVGSALTLSPGSNVMDAKIVRSSYQPIPSPPGSVTDIKISVQNTSANITWLEPMFPSDIFGPDAYRDWEYSINYRPYGSQDGDSIVANSNSFAVLSNLSPGVTYIFEITTRGNITGSSSVTTPNQYIFTTFGSDEIPSLLVTTNEGALSIDTLEKNVGFLSSEMRVDGSSASTVNSYFNPVRYYISDDDGDFWIQDGTSLPVRSMLTGRSNPMYIQLDWVSRQLYWVEQQRKVINRIPTIPEDLSSDFEMFDTSSKSINGMAIDGLNGVLFWLTSDGITGRGLNELLPSWSCYSMNNLRGITLDPANNRIFVAYFVNSDVTIATLNYTTFACDNSSVVSREVDGLTFSSSKNISIAYGANNLYLAQESVFTVYSMSAEFSTADSSFKFVFDSIDATPPSNIPTELRALSVVLKDNQPLPPMISEDMVFDITGNRTLLTPPTPGPATLNNVTSNTTFIDIMWDVSDFSFSNVFYKVDLRLTTAVDKIVTIIMTNVLDGSSLQLFNQSFSTSVDATITPYSLWYSGEQVTSSFVSPAEKPSQVQNVRVNVFFPIRNSDVAVTAQIVWDGLTIEQAGGMLSFYSIDVFNDDDELITEDNEFNRSISSHPSFMESSPIYNGPPFIVSSTSTEFSLTLSGISQLIVYPLRPNRTYSATVQAVNSAGAGEPSEKVIFDTIGASPPQEVLVVGPSGGNVVGVGNSTSLSSVTPPVALNNVNRTLYYYNEANNSIYRGSLDINVDPIEVTQLNSNLEPLAFTFDWMSQTVYIIGRNTETLMIEIWTVFEPRATAVLLANYDIVTPRVVNVSAIINPYKGYLSWTQASSDGTDVYQLNLRDVNNPMSLISSSSKKRSLDLSTLQVTSALAWDPITQEVWLCDSNTGDVIVCNVTSSALTNCEVVVDASLLEPKPNGLPADQLSIDESTIYWSQYSIPTVYYINRTEPFDLKTIDLANDNFILVGVSPGQQPLPDLKLFIEGDATFIDDFPPYCLSPDYSRNPSLRPFPMLVSKTNTTIQLSWMAAGLPEACDDVVFSLLPSSYIIHISEMSSSDFMMDTDKPDVYGTTTVIDGLKPFTTYTFHITASNIYTTDRSGTQGEDAVFKTDEGVPSAIDTLRVIVYGPKHVYITWKPLTEAQLRGNETFQSFNFYRDDGFSRTGITNNSFNFSDLVQNSTYQFGVAVNNKVLTSPTTFEIDQTFSLPPLANVIVLGSTSFNINVTLTEEHEHITAINVFVNGTELPKKEIDLSAPFPKTISYSWDEGEPFTNYSVVVEGVYIFLNISGIPPLGPVTESSKPVTVTTESSVPDAPIIERVGSRIQWVEPDNNGERIDQYILSYYQQGESSSNSLMRTYPPINTSVDIDSLALREGNTYIFFLQARNSEGLSEASEEVDYTIPEATSFGLAQILMYIVAPVGSLLLLIFVLLFIICCCCLCATPDKRATFRPDYELIRLREDYAKSRQHAFNPNYMWSRDDYTAYQDDLENINKFPRNKLRLENFIDRGEFGEVYQGTAIDILAADSGPTPVAVKTMRKGASQDEKEKFLSEAALMSNFNHQNIVKVLGVCLDNDPIFIIMELMPAGDLLKFLREARQESGPPLLTLAEQIQVAIDVGQGCRYLEQQHFIHRDIAGRNCLVTSKGADRVVKIGDFGLAKDLYTSDYYQVEGQRKLPVRWMAPEALLQGKFTTETDIWSYGVLLWEIFTFGNQPYPGRNNQEVLQFVTGGGRLEKPENCSIRVYKLMQACWETPSERLHFAQIVEYLAHYLEHVNNKRDSYYSDDDEEGGGDGGEDELTRKNSKPSRTSSVRSVGLINLARQGSVRIRRSIRVRASLKKDDMENQNHTGLNSEENLVDDGAFRERGPF